MPHAKPDFASRSVTVLGCTGSIGESAFSLLMQHQSRFQVVALTAYDNVARLVEQAKALGAKRAVIGNESRYHELKSALSGSAIEAMAGPDAMCEAAQIPSDIVLAGVVGAAGLAPVLAAIRRGATIALANKEPLVCAGALMMEEARKHGATILPVDSEHNAIFQVFDFEQPETVEKIILTASGGPFRRLSTAEMKSVTPQQAVRHPNWSMGAKISVDSATMMNKGLEVIEACHLFPVDCSQIDVLVHPESVIHSMVRYTDGSVLAQMGTPDMRIPIAYALAWPQRIKTLAPALDFSTLGTLSFEVPDEIRFPALRLAREAWQTGGNAPAVLNAANEVAVSRFLRNEIGFLDIMRIVETVLTQLPPASCTTLEDVFEADRQARAAAESI